jgi:septal ring factor EnvC (AmiA/AmiB activator)
MRRGGVAAAMFCLAMVCSPLSCAQDVRGIEVCTVEKDMTRRTSCLQANVQYLSQTLDKTRRDAQDRLAAVGRELTAAKADIATLHTVLAKVQAELAEVKKTAEKAAADAAKASAAPAKK